MKYTNIKKILSLILVLILSLSLAACGSETPAGETSEAESETTSTEVSEESEEEVSVNDIEVDLDETGNISGFDASDLGSKEESEESTELTEEAYDLFLPAVTENEAFNTAFSRNEIDIAYYEVASDSGSTTAIVRASNRASAQWQDVIDKAYEELKSISADPSAIEKDQNDWNASADASVQNIKDKSGSDGLANITVSYEIMLFYREKAGQLLEQIYAVTGEIDLTVEAVG